MDAKWDTDTLPGGEGETNQERVAGMRSLLELHRELVRQKREIREGPNDLRIKLEAMAEVLEPDDLSTEAIAVLLESAQVRTLQLDELDERIDQVMDAIMMGTIAIVERLKPVDPGDR